MHSEFFTHMSLATATIGLSDRQSPSIILGSRARFGGRSDRRRRRGDRKDGRLRLNGGGLSRGGDGDRIQGQSPQIAIKFYVNVRIDSECLLSGLRMFSRLLLE
jgi:hypothetical protein